MGTVRVYLFGKFHFESGGQTMYGLEPRKALELFCYLLLNAQRPHHREALAALLWGDYPTVQSKKNLRQTLWQLQAALDSGPDQAASRVLLTQPDWVQIDAHADLWLDVAVFEQAANLVQGIPGEELDPPRVQALRTATALYTGDLLEGWYQDWCVYERERLQNQYLLALDKLMGCCERHCEYESGVAHGDLILRFDRARERTHQRMMRLYYLAGDRAAALRQFEHCVAALHDELGVKPSRRTLAIYDQIRRDQPLGGGMAGDERERPATTRPAADALGLGAARGPVQDAVLQLHGLLTVVAEMQDRLQQTLESLERTVSDRYPHAL